MDNIMELFERTDVIHGWRCNWTEHGLSMSLLEIIAFVNTSYELGVIVNDGGEVDDAEIAATVDTRKLVLCSLSPKRVHRHTRAPPSKGFALEQPPAGSIFVHTPRTLSLLSGNAGR